MESKINQKDSASDQIYTTFEDMPEDFTEVLSKKLPDTDFGDVKIEDDEEEVTEQKTETIFDNEKSFMENFIIIFENLIV